MEIPLDLTCWYFNHRRVLELIGSSSLSAINVSDQLLKMQILSSRKNDLLEWLKKSDVQPLDKLLLKNDMMPDSGMLFTHYTNFFFKGLSKVGDDLRKGKTPRSASGHAKLDYWEKNARLKFSFYHDHLTANSAWFQLSGQKRMFMLGVVQEVNGKEITALPYVIANVVSNPLANNRNSSNLWSEYNELHIDDIDSFSKVIGYHPRRTKSSLDALKDISEREIKTAFAQIINEPNIPKDWGGESSDLFSTHVIYDGKPISTAFIFKGPAKFKPMTSAELGKNGDQIVRLYNEPADLLILQHCHKITNDVRKTMRAFSQQVSNPRLCCIIDGYGTLRILECYEKCGFSMIQI